MKDMSIHGRSRSFDSPTNGLEVLKLTVRGLLEKFLSESNVEIRRVGVKVSGLAKAEKSQKQLTSFIE
jgi:nucleotidyltransferase/DNA polymerase involved in DNA repair